MGSNRLVIHRPVLALVGLLVWGLCWHYPDKTAVEELLLGMIFEIPQVGNRVSSKPPNQDHRKGALFSCCFTAQNMY